jgi:hypothetical protein
VLARSKPRGPRLGQREPEVAKEGDEERDAERDE